MIAFATVLLCISLGATQGMTDTPIFEESQDLVNENADIEDDELDLAKEFLYAVTDPPLSRERRDTEVEASGDTYPTEVPRIDGAVFVFEVTFTIQNMTVPAFDKNGARERFQTLLKDSFRGVLGFLGIKITDVRSGSVIVSTACDIDAAKAHDATNNETQKQELKQSLLTACDKVAKSSEYDVKNDSETWNTKAEGLVADAEDMCKAEGDLCAWGSRCEENACVHLCADVDCGQRGSCQLGGTAKAEPVCKCESDDWFNYTGDKCSVSEFRWEITLAISGGVGGAVVVLLGTCLAISCYRHRRRASKDNFSVRSNQSEESHPEPNNGNRRYGSLFSSTGFGRSLFRASYFASTSPGATPSYKLYGTDSVWGPNEIDEQFSDFVPRLDHIDPEVQYTISRPKIG
ncbi:mucin-17-like [Haliotis asinina]|uniref:mucin-17-like n=1 Tax=Haliotis asinina TaxID=109174 RepID=UPI003531B70D